LLATSKIEMIITTRMTAIIIANAMKILRVPLELADCTPEWFDAAAGPCNWTWGASVRTEGEAFACMKGRGGTCGGAESARFCAGEFKD
jgi:hypothetical protein